MREASQTLHKLIHRQTLLWLMPVLLVSAGCKTVSPRKAPSAMMAPPEVSSVTPPVQPETSVDVEPPATVEDITGERKLTKGQENLILQELWAGTLAHQKGEIEEARLHYQRILDIVPDSPHALCQMAKTYLETENYDEALKYAEKAVQADPSKTDALEILGQAYAQKKEYAKAAEQYRRILELNPHSIPALQQLAEMRALDGKVDEAVEIYRQLVVADPGRSGLYYFFISSILTDAQRYPEAIEAFLKLLDEYPDHYKTYFDIADLYERLGKVDEAVDVFLRALKQGPPPQVETLVRSRLARLYLRRGSRAEAYAQYARIRQLNPEDKSAVSTMALLLLHDKEYDRALGLADELLAADPMDLQSVLLKCDILAQKDQWKESADLFLKSFQDVIEQVAKGQFTPDRADEFCAALLEAKTRVLFIRSQRVDALIGVLRDGIQKCPESRYFPLALLVTRVEADQKDAQLTEEIEQVLRQWDSSVGENDRKNYLLYLAALYENGTLGTLSEGEFAPIVIDILLQASEKFTDDAASPLILSILQFNANDWANAEKSLLLVTQRTPPSDPKHQEALERLALACEKMKRVDDAVGVIRKMIEIAPEKASPYNMLGYLYAENNRNLEEAETLVKKALEIAPNDGNFIDSLGWVYYRQGRYQEALDTLILARQKSGQDHPVICDHLGDAYQAMGKIPEAVELWRRALEIGPQYPFDFTPEFKRAVEDKIRKSEQQLTP
ncbi:MAG TPA: tetratricopeptide repeat protein [bacterium]|nr:tetratricopeptide repeat protein [bacterium]HQL61247.1 tetratricopeptide repeat protein [bacterium]